MAGMANNLLKAELRGQGVVMSCWWKTEPKITIWGSSFPCITIKYADGWESHECFQGGYRLCCFLRVPKVLDWAEDGALFMSCSIQKRQSVVRRVQSGSLASRVVCWRLNPDDTSVMVIHADAFEILPPEPADVVICEMIHSAS